MRSCLSRLHARVGFGRLIAARTVALSIASVDKPLASHGWQRGLWIAAGSASLVLGFVGIALPVLPTVPFLLLAAFCFSRGSERCEGWLLAHPRLGPPIRSWREHHAMPRRAKQLALASMTIGSAFAWWTLPGPWCGLPAGCCAAVAVWMWRLPTA